MTTKDIYALPIDQFRWRKLPSGNYVKLGDDGKNFKGSPLQIQGSKHLLYVAGTKIIGVGCIRYNTAWWNEHYQDVGEAKGYTSEQIQEYRHWLDVAIEWQAKNA